VRPAGIVDDDVEPAELRRRRLHEAGPVRGAGDVGLHELALDRRGDALATFWIDVGEHHLRAFLREALRDSLAEARASAGNDRDLVAQAHRGLRHCLNGLCSHSSST
jgi:hypothetical protein